MHKALAVSYIVLQTDLHTVLALPSPFAATGALQIELRMRCDAVRYTMQPGEKVNLNQYNNAHTSFVLRALLPSAQRLCTYKVECLYNLQSALCGWTPFFCVCMCLLLPLPSICMSMFLMYIVVMITRTKNIITSCTQICVALVLLCETGAQRTHGAQNRINKVTRPCGSWFVFLLLCGEALQMQA